MGETFQLKFNSNSENLTVSIDEPINFATVDFQLSQKDKGYGRDVSFNGGETQFEFVKYRNHYLDKLLTYNKTYGFESIVELVITLGTISTIIGELDFATAITDDLEYFKCKVIQKSSLQVIKRRKSVKIDLLGSKDVDGNYLAPLVPENVLLYSKPIYQVSTWSQNEDFSLMSDEFASISNVNPAKYINRYEISDSIIPFENDNNCKVITVKSKLNNINIKVSNLSIDSYGSYSVAIIAKYGTTLGTATELNIFSINADGIIIINTEGIISSLKINDNVWLYIEINPADAYQTFIISGMQVSISGENTVYNSVVPAFRLINVMNKVIKSISPNSLVISDRFGTPITGDFYNNFIFNGNSLRVLPDKPFNISLEDIEKSIVEMNADWEIKPDGNVFFGIEDDFYTNIECGVFTNTQFSQMNKTFNPRFSINEFNYGYKNFQSLKENEEPNSADVIHGESKWVLGNKSVENKKDISIEWTRDSFLIETNRRKSLEITEGTASQDDTDLFIIQAVPNNSIINMSYEPILSHSYTNGILTLTSTGDINFRVVGMRVGDVFQILSPSSHNIGNYVILSVSDATLGLTLTSGSTPAGYTVPFITYFIHMLRGVNTPNMMSTISGFTDINNLIGSNVFANLKYSIRRNIELYWKKYLTTCNLYHNYNGIANTWYKNNNKFSSTYNAINLTEREVIDTYGIKPLLTPFIYNDVIFSNVEFIDFITLQNRIRTDRGYILTKDNNGLPLKLYPMTMKYDNLSKELTIKGEEKFDEATIYPQLVPNIMTLNASDITFSNSKVGGFIKSNGGNSITTKGIVYNTATNPTVANTLYLFNEGVGNSDFIGNLSFLEPLKTYYARAYAQNGIGLVYGNEISFTTLGEAQIGTQIWTLKNLDVSTYRDGTVIPQVNSSLWSGLTTGAWCYYNNGTSDIGYGKLYNWYAVNDIAHGGLAPLGYHVPALTEMNVLITYLGGSSVAGGKMKEIGTTHWTAPNTGANNSSNFYGLAGGRISGTSFVEKGLYGNYWINTQFSSTNGYMIQLSNSSESILTSNIIKKDGIAVRLIKD